MAIYKEKKNEEFGDFSISGMLPIESTRKCTVVVIDVVINIRERAVKLNILCEVAA